MEATPLPPMPQSPLSQAPHPSPVSSPVQAQTPKFAAPKRETRALHAPRASFLWVFLFIIAVFVFLAAYFVFSKPNTGPASLIFSKIFPPESGLIKLQQVDLDVDSVINHPVFGRLKEKGVLPIQIPPLGKPNPFL
ncbi:MAG: hypothetical protein A2418_01615 [Candidatus Brennerbacteria bacterium RIFOXYC1_FULL_41_11]|nr:MAG: hypothetical protein A2418_01615 [Candidatus Brennerbacteria bacterium RIFOXYC1_FULL_41_11]